MLEAELFQNSRHRDKTGSVERRVDNLDILRHLLDDIRMNDLLLERLHVRVIDFLPEILKKTSLDSFLLGNRLHIVIIRHRVDLGDDSVVVRRRHLSAVLPVCLVAVILGRIMARRDLYTGLAAKVTDRE